jgi:hypothetical protein
LCRAGFRALEALRRERSRGRGGGRLRQDILISSI